MLTQSHSDYLDVRLLDHVSFYELKVLVPNIPLGLVDIL